jgi:hypothetical protein
MLSDAHRQAIADALVDREVDLERVYLQLERISEGYEILERGRELNPPNKARLQEQERERIISELITWKRGYRENLNGQLNDFRQHPIAGHDEIEPELCRIIRGVESELANLEAVRQRICSHIDNLDAVIRQFRGKRNPYRENMYIGLLRIWTDIIGGKPTYNRPPLGGPPYGPLIDFFRACLISILNDKTPGAHGIAKIIDRIRSAMSPSTHRLQHTRSSNSMLLSESNIRSRK